MEKDEDAALKILEGVSKKYLWYHDKTLGLFSSESLSTHECGDSVVSPQDTSYTSLEARAVIRSDYLYSPSFDYRKVLLVSRDRPAMWQYWPWKFVITHVVYDYAEGLSGMNIVYIYNCTSSQNNNDVTIVLYVLVPHIVTTLW